MSADQGYCWPTLGEPCGGCHRCGGSGAKEKIYCAAQTFRGTREEPSEYCENEVDSEGDLCSEHDADARMEDDYDRYLQMKED